VTPHRGTPKAPEHIEYHHESHDLRYAQGMNGFVVAVLRALLVLMFAGSIAVQLCAGLLAQPVVGGASEVVLICLIVLSALCVEAVLASVWVLAGMVSDESIFDGRRHADRWADVAIWALAVAAVFAAAGLVYFLVSQALSVSATEIVLAIAAAAGVSAALALLVVVMRRLLHTAIQYQTDLSEVI
jgi:hypothetical protein